MKKILGWEKIRVRIIERAAGKCEYCYCPDDKLSVHHIIERDSSLATMTGMDVNAPWNLIAVCGHCHAWMRLGGTFHMQARCFNRVNDILHRPIRGCPGDEFLLTDWLEERARL